MRYSPAGMEWGWEEKTCWVGDKHAGMERRLRRLTCRGVDGDAIVSPRHFLLIFTTTTV